MTMVCLVGDLLDTVCQVLRFGKPGDEYSDLLLLVVCYIFLLIDVFYFLWVSHMSLKVPAEQQQYIGSALLGFGSKMRN
jgi:hypothetical protein